MIKQKYSKQIHRILSESIQPTPRMFIFGSSVQKKGNFSDVDVGLIDGPIKEGALYRAKENLEESTLPYKVDLVDFNTADASFRKEVLSQKIQWLT
jgi:uncharacterized protein